MTAPAKPGRYGLKFDLVSEGIDWFEACGSETTTKTLVVILRLVAQLRSSASTSPSS